MDNKEVYQQELKSAIKRLKEMENSPDWKENGVKPCPMFKIQIEGKLAAKGIDKVSYPINKVFDFLINPETLKKINPMLSQNTLLYQQPTGKYTIKYTRYKGQWPVSDRDFVSVVGSDKTNENKIYIATSSCSFPHPEVNKVVRGQIYTGGYILESIDQNTTQVTYISNSDSKGNIPGMLKNTLTVKQGQIASRIGPAMLADNL